MKVTDSRNFRLSTKKLFTDNSIFILCYMYIYIYIYDCLSHSWDASSLFSCCKVIVNDHAA